MGTLIFWIVVIGTSIWMAFDAKQIGYDKKDVKGFAGMGPVGWFFGGLLLWIVVFPLYLASRSKLKAAASAGASASTDGMGQVADAPSAGGLQPENEDTQGGVGLLRKNVGTAVGIFFGGWAVLALGWNLIGTEPDATPEPSSPEPPEVAQPIVPIPPPVPSAGPSAEYLGLVAKIEARNSLGAPASLQNPAHVEMVSTITKALMSSPQAEKIELLVDEPAFSIVFLDCDNCTSGMMPRIRSWARAYSETFARCFESNQQHREWPRQTFECVIEQESALIELDERMSGESGDIAEIQRLDSCLTRHIRGKKYQFIEANACVAKAQGGPAVGYSFARLN